MEFDLLVSGILLVSCLSLGVSGIIITRNKTTLTPIARRKLKEYEEELKSNYTEVRRLKGVIARNQSNILNLSNVIKRPSKCRLCDGHGKIYRNDIGARGIEYFYLEECDRRCYGKGFEPN